MSKGYSATSTKGVQNAKKRLQKLLRACDTVPTKVLQEEAPKLYAQIIAATPYKTGKLERSVRVSVSGDKRRPGLNASASARSETGYNYAGIQHENTDFQHPVKGTDHYIRDPFNLAIRRIKRKIKKGLEVK